jgi:outer membrane lipoprotein SlyB
MFNKFATLVFVLCSFAAHAQQWEGTSTGYGTYQQPQQVQKATVLSVRDVQLSAQTQGFGANMLGTAIGGALGGVIGRKSNDFTVMAVTTTIGAAVGNHVASGSTVRAAQEIVYQVDGQQPQAVTQSLADGVRFAPGQRVILIGGGRIAPATF